MLEKTSETFNTLLTLQVTVKHVYDTYKRTPIKKSILKNIPKYFSIEYKYNNTWLPKSKPATNFFALWPTNQSITLNKY